MMKVNKKQIDNKYNFEFVFSQNMNGVVTEKIGKEITEVIDDENINSVIFDFANVNYLSTTFLNLCLCTSRNSELFNFKIINADSCQVKKVFELTGYDNFISVKTDKREQKEIKI
jgi:anti-anti-sigma regulatory factor